MTGRPSGGRSPKRRRLSRSAEFERVYRHGRSKSNRFLVLYAFPREEHADNGPRLGLSVSRRVGAAVERARVKRLLREAFWAEAERLPDGSDYVVVARPDAREVAERDGMAGVQAALAELVDALGGERQASVAPAGVPQPGGGQTDNAQAEVARAGGAPAPRGGHETPTRRSDRPPTPLSDREAAR